MTPLRRFMLLSLCFGLAGPLTAADLEPLCRRDQRLCGDYRVLIERLDSGDALNDLHRRFHELEARARQVLVFERGLTPKQADEILSAAGAAIRARLAALSLGKIPRDLGAVESSLRLLELRLDALEREAGGGRRLEPGAARERLAALSAEGARVWSRLQDSFLAIGHMGSPENSGLTPEEFDGALKLQGRANPLAYRVAELSRRLKRAEKMEALLKDPFAGGKTPGPIAAATERGPGPGGLLRPPQAAPRPQPAAPPSPGGFNDHKIQASGLLWSLGLTRTVGQPGSRARYAFKQTGGTCVIAAAVQVLEEAGAFTGGLAQRKLKETALYEKAVRGGLFVGLGEGAMLRQTGGVPPQYMGDLLEFPYRRHYAASDSELLRSVAAGRMAIARVDGGVLWGKPSSQGYGHAVVVTGAEVTRWGARLIGYYINDPGTGEGGRFVPAEQFHSAWRGAGAIFVEPL